MRVELVGIHTALTSFVAYEWIGIFTYSLSTIQVIKHHHANDDTGGARHSHHHMLLMGCITELLETRRWEGLRTSLHKIRAHTDIRDNDIADASAKLVVKHFDTLPSPQTLRVDLVETTTRPTRWVMYTAKPPPSDPVLSTGTNCASLHRPVCHHSGSGPPIDARLDAPVS